MSIECLLWVKEFLSPVIDLKRHTNPSSMRRLLGKKGFEAEKGKFIEMSFASFRKDENRSPSRNVLEMSRQQFSRLRKFWLTCVAPNVVLGLLSAFWNENQSECYCLGIIEKPQSVIYYRLRRRWQVHDWGPCGAGTSGTTHDLSCLAFASAPWQSQPGTQRCALRSV